MVKVSAINTKINSSKNQVLIKPYGLKQKVALNSQNQQVIYSYSIDNLKANYVNAISFGQAVKPAEVQLGANFDKKNNALNFGFYSKNATRVELCVFDKAINGNQIINIPLKKNPDNKWTTSIPNKELKENGINLKDGDAVLYGYRVWGPNWTYDKDWKPGSKLGFNKHVDDNGNRFNPNKLQVDPYAKEWSHDPISPGKQGGYDGTLYATGPFHYKKDTAALGSKGVFFSETEKIDTGKKPTRALKDDVIYEVHVKGLTKLDEHIPEELRGTYAGAALKAPYLKEMGVTMTEFLPIQETQNEDNEHEFRKDKSQNYWGYMTNGFNSPDRYYAHDKSLGGPTREVKQMVKAYHDNDIKVCMDVVFNHTGEGSLWGRPDGSKDKDTVNSYTMHGSDNSTYFELADNGKDFWDNTGCGGNFNIANPAARKLAIDSIKYWSEEMGIDAFRFDLAAVLGNTKEKDGFEVNLKAANSFFNELAKEVKVRGPEGGEGIDIIVEPWAASGFGAYQLGNFPKHTYEWNDKFRRTIRSILNTQEHAPFSYLASSIGGSQNVFGSPRTRSINFVTAHDGFTLNDLFSYNQKENQHLERYSDGGDDDNISWNQRGDREMQVQAARNSMAMLMLSNGTPMILGGDEILRTKYGNNNTYNHDKPFNYLNWNLNDEQKGMQKFTNKMIHFRQDHSSIGPGIYYRGTDSNDNGIKDITWLKGDATEADGSYLDDPDNTFLAYKVDGTEFHDSADSIYVAINKGDWNVDGVRLPEPKEGNQWYLVANTSEEVSKDGFITPKGQEIPVSKITELTSEPRSIMMYIEKPIQKN